MLLLGLPCFLNMADMSKFPFWQHAFIAFYFAYLVLGLSYYLWIRVAVYLPKFFILKRI